MHEVKPAVLLVEEMTSRREALFKIYNGYRRCYSDGDSWLITDSKTKSTEELEAFIRKMLKAEHPHESPLEHSSLAFHLTCSRACSHQLVRHRIASYCVAGDTRISTSSQKTDKKTIAELYAMPRQYQDMVKVRCVDEKTGILGYNTLKSVIASGQKEVFEVKTAHGYSIKATGEHRFFTEKGWQRLRDLRVGDNVYINGVALYKNRDWLYEAYHTLGLSQQEIGALCGVVKHTIRAWIKRFGLQKPMRSWRIGKIPPNKGKTKENYEPLRITSQKLLGNQHCKPETRRGDKNPMWKGDSVGIGGGYIRTHKEVSKTGKCQLCGFEGVTELHHKDKNPRNSNQENVQELCIACHKAIHKQEIRQKIVLSPIVLITPAGVVDTYDIEMADPHHNFIANGFVVHNSQQSQRYVRMDDLPVIVPPSVNADMAKSLAFALSVSQIEEAYKAFLAKGIPAEDARYLLPACVATQIVVTMNFRSLLHFFNERCCNRAQWEIRDLAGQMLTICKELYPCVFEDAGPKCLKLKHCPEAKPCGRQPWKEQ